MLVGLRRQVEMYSWIYDMQGCSPEVPSDPSGWNKSRKVPGLSLERADGLFQEGVWNGLKTQEN